jgi:hypothetical protein
MLTYIKGAAYASLCNALHVSYTLTSNAFIASLGTITTTVTVSTYPTIAINTSAAEPFLCDNRPRFTSFRSGIEYSGSVATLATPSISEEILYEPVPTDAFTEQPPSCSIGRDDCFGLLQAYSKSWEIQDASWAAANTLTISLASPPSILVVNNETTVLPTANGDAPPITIHNQTYLPQPGPTPSYTITNATAHFGGGLVLTPGGLITAAWEGEHYYTESTPPPCLAPYTRDLQAYGPPKACNKNDACTVMGFTLQLQYFAPPSTSRDLCANTSPGYNKSKL